MDWTQAWREERAALMRLAALLHALAGLAERATGRSAGVRGVVLWLLRRAEAVAREFANDHCATGPLDICRSDQFLTDTPAAAAMAQDHAGNRPEDAMRLAASLTALAWRLEAQAALLWSLCGRGSGRAARAGTVRLAAGRFERALPALARLAFAGPCSRAAPDTS